MKVNKSKEIPVEELRRLLDYDPETGILTWKISPQPKFKVGSVAGCTHSTGYIRIGINLNYYLGHRVCYAIHHGMWPLEDIDHADGNRINNSIKNLRQANNAQNQHNSKIRKTNRSGVKGVCWNKASGNWQARFGCNGKRILVGYFNNIDEAAEAIRQRRDKEHGEFAHH